MNDFRPMGDITLMIVGQFKNDEVPEWNGVDNRNCVHRFNVFLSLKG